MINGLEGIPGSGKSYEAVVFHVCEALKRGVRVITNLPLNVDRFAAIDPAYRELIEIRKRPQPIRGTWDSKAAGRDEPAYKLFPDGHTEDAPDDADIFGGPWDYYSTWKHKDGNGPLFIIDECHVPLPTMNTPKQVVEWFKIHRHFNANVLLMTQNFRDMNQPIARLIAILVKVRKADILGREAAYIRKVHAGYRGAVISTEQRDYKPEFFDLYKSHTQGNSVAETSARDVKPFIVKFRRFSRVFYVFAGVGLLWTVYSMWSKPASAKVATKPPVAALVAQPAYSASIPLASSSVASVPSQGALAPPLPDAIPDPHKSKGLHITGRVEKSARVLYTFALSTSGLTIGAVTSDELTEAGFIWKPLSMCSGVLRWRTDPPRTVTCDAPVMAQGSTANPVVVVTPPGSGPVIR